MDAFRGCYKDGTEPGTRDCRWLASVLFLTRYVLMFIAYTTTFNYPLASIVLVIVSIVFVTVQPFKQSVSHYNHITVTLLLLFAVGYSSAIGTCRSMKRYLQFMYSTSLFIVAILPFLYISFLSLRWMHSNFGRLKAGSAMNQYKFN